MCGGDGRGKVVLRLMTMIRPYINVMTFLLTCLSGTAVSGQVSITFKPK